MSESMTERLRRAIQSADVSRYEISRRTGVSQAQLSRFVHGKQRTVTLETADRLKLAGIKLD